MSDSLIEDVRVTIDYICFTCDGSGVDCERVRRCSICEGTGRLSSRITIADFMGLIKCEAEKQAKAVAQGASE